MEPSAEQYTPPRNIISEANLHLNESWGGHQTISIQAALLAVDKWPELLEKTSATGDEHGVLIYRIGSKLVTSNIIHGEEGRFTLPLALNPIDIFRKRRNLIVINTHHMPPQLNHLPTTAISGGDIASFTDSNDLVAAVQIDRGGIHLLTRSRLPSSYVSGEKAQNMINQAFSVAKAGDQSVLEVMQSISQQLNKYGITYYFSDQINASPNDIITFEKC